MFNFQRGESFGKNIRNHVSSGAVEKCNVALRNDPTNEMKPYINVFSTSVKLTVFGQSNSQLIIREKNCRRKRRFEDFRNELTKPNGFLGSVRGSDIFALGG